MSFEPVEDVIDWYKNKEAAIATDDKYVSRIAEPYELNVAEISIESFSNTVTNIKPISTMCSCP